MYNKFFAILAAWIGALLLAGYLWPARKDVIGGAGVVLIFIVLGIFALSRPQAVRQMFAEGQATEGFRQQTLQTPLLAIQFMGGGFCIVGLLVLYAIFFQANS